jgi:hypothetical protein
MDAAISLLQRSLPMFPVEGNYPYIKQEEDNSSILTLIKQIDQLSDIFIFNNVMEIKRFLFNKKEILPILIEIYEQVISIFDKPTLYLDVYNDPEEDYSGLFIEIDSNLPLNESIKRLDKIVDWFVTNIPNEIRGYVTVTLK